MYGNQLNPLDSQNAHLHDETFTTHDIFLRRVLEHLRPDEHIILSWFFGWGGEASSSRYDLKALSYQQLGHGSWNPWYPFQPWQEAQRRPQLEWVALRGPNKSAGVSIIVDGWFFSPSVPWGVRKVATESARAGGKQGAFTDEERSWQLVSFMLHPRED